jgi:methyl-accepting chemotaxis protein
VASEVRSLAQRSATAAKEIKSLIGDSVEKVEAGQSLVEGAGRTMGEIQSAVGRVTQLVETVTLASNEQASGVDQINTGISQIEGATQQNAALVEQSAASSAVLKQQAAVLKETVQIFRLKRGAGGAVDAGRRAA